jgi:hypothetical protein
MTAGVPLQGQSRGVVKMIAASKQETSAGHECQKSAANDIGRRPRMISQPASFIGSFSGIL